MDTNDDDAFYVHIHNEKKIRFGSARKGIYIIDGDITQYDRMWKDLPNETLDEVLYNTVEQNKQKYPNRLYQRAIRARKFQNIMMRPGSRQLDDIAIHHRKPPISKSDIIAADNIFGTNLGALKGKTARTPPKHVFYNIDPVTRDILDKYRNVTLCIDIMFVNKVPFIITSSRYMKFITVKVLQNRQKEENFIENSIERYNNVREDRVYSLFYSW